MNCNCSVNATFRSCKSMVLVLHANFISCWVSFVLRYLYKSNSSCLCHCENSKPFCLAKSWPCTKTRHGSKILDVNVCHILLLQIQLSGGFVLLKKLQNFILAVLPFRRIKKTNVQSLHWSFGFIEISTLTPSMRSKIQKTIILVFTHASFPLHQLFYWSILTADDRIKCRCANSRMTSQVGGFQNPGVCLQAFHSFLPHPLPALLLARFFMWSLTLIPHSLLLNHTEMHATRAMLHSGWYLKTHAQSDTWSFADQTKI